METFKYYLNRTLDPTIQIKKDLKTNGIQVTKEVEGYINASLLGKPTHIDHPKQQEIKKIVDGYVTKGTKIDFTC